jgi:hypothetical protein
MIRGVSRAAHLTFLLSLGVALMNCFSLNAQTSSTMRAVPLVTQAVNEDSRVALTGNVHPFAVARYDQGEASQSTPTGRIQLVLSRCQAQQQALVQYLSRMSIIQIRPVTTNGLPLRNTGRNSVSTIPIFKR